MKNRLPFPRLVVLGLLLGNLGAHAAPAEAVRVVSYNLLNYDNQASTRNPHFRTVFQNMPPMDVVCVQEVQGVGEMTGFRNTVLNVVDPGWIQAAYWDNGSFNQGLYFRSTTMTKVEEGFISNTPRHIAWYRLRPIPYTSSEADLLIFVTHFRAGSTNDALRLVEAQALRSFMNDQPPGTNMVVLGDFNMRASTESAYQEMVESQADNDGRVFDPVNSPGTWYSNFSFRFLHTQSTRTANLGDGGATGGMDDRFDQILVTSSLLDGEGMDALTSTYTAYGQDGNRYNQEIVSTPVIPEGSTVANALYRASDHLPVFMEFQVPALIEVAASLDFGTVIEGASAQLPCSVANVAALPADELDYVYTAPAGFGAPAGTLEVAAGDPASQDPITMDTSTFGIRSGTLVIDSDDVETPSVNVQLDGVVLRHADPSLANGVSVLADTVDFGIFEEGSAPDTSVTVFNLGYDSLQALLEVYEGVITGGEGRFTFTGGFGSATVDSTPAGFGIMFDDAGAARDADTTWTATLTLRTRDDSGVPGAADQADLVVSLTATVEAGSQIAVGDPVPRGVSLLRMPFPNPFLTATRVRFTLTESGAASLVVYDVVGRPVRSLLDGWFSAGEHDAVWDGRTDRGFRALPGVYFLDLNAPGIRQTRRMTKLR